MKPTAVALVDAVIAAQSIDLDRPRQGPNDIQLAVAIAVAVGAIVLSSLFVKYYSSLILDDEEADHAKAVTTGLRSRDWFEVRIPRSALDDGFETYREQLHDGFRGDFTADVPTVRGALGETRRIWLERRRAATEAVRDEVPALSRLLSLDAVLYLLAGSIVVVPLETWGELATASSESPDPAAIADAVASSFTLVVETIAAFPFAGMVYAFAVIAVLEVGSLLYEHVFAVFFALLVGSILIWVADRVVANDVEPRLYRTKPQAAIRLGGVAAATWVVGVGVAFATRSVHHTLGNVLTAGVVVAIVGVVLAKKTNPVVNDALAALRYCSVEDDVVSAATRAKTLAGRLDDPVVDDVVLESTSTDSTPGITTRLRRAGAPIVKLAAAVIVTVGVTSGVGFATFTLEAGVWGATCGLLASLVVAGGLLRHEARAAYRRLTTAYEQADEDGVGPTGTVAYVAGRKVFGVLGVFASLILPVYVFQAVTTGKAVAVAEVVLVESSAEVKVALAFFALVFAAFAVVQTRPAWGDLSVAVRRALDRNGLRLALLSRGFPFLVVVIAFPALASTPFFGRLGALVGAVGLAVATKAFLWVKDRAEFAYAEIDDEPPKPGRVLVKGVVVTDAHDREIAVVEENDHRIAAPVAPIDDQGDDEGDELPVGGVDELVDQIVADSRSIFEDVEPEPSVYAYYYERIGDGLVDFRDARREYIGTIGKSIEVELEKAGRDGVDLETLDERLTDDFDEDLYRRKLREERKRPDGVVIYDGRVKKH